VVAGGVDAAAGPVGAETPAVCPTYGVCEAIIPEDMTPAICPGSMVGMGTPFGKGIMMGEAKKNGGAG
jgi:hypothetical protein